MNEEVGSFHLQEQREDYYLRAVRIIPPDSFSCSAHRNRQIHSDGLAIGAFTVSCTATGDHEMAGLSSTKKMYCDRVQSSSCIN
jgi:hypothetical protein